jgi:fucose 4-O-acetylase-like acetyltransferase
MLLVIGLIGAASCFALVPRAKSWFSALGAATLVVYLFHGFFVLTAQYEGFPDWADRHVVWSRVITTCGAVALAFLLAAPPVARVLKTVVDPIGWLEARRKAWLPHGERVS